VRVAAMHTQAGWGAYQRAYSEGKFVHPEAKQAGPGSPKPPSPIKTATTRSISYQFFSFFLNLFIFEMAISYTEEDLRKACDEAQRTRRLRSVTRRWAIPLATLYRRLNGALPRSVAHEVLEVRHSGFCGIAGVATA